MVRLAEETEIKPKPMVEWRKTNSLAIMKHYSSYPMNFQLHSAIRWYIKKYMVDFARWDNKVNLKRENLTHLI